MKIKQITVTYVTSSLDDYIVSYAVGEDVTKITQQGERPSFLIHHKDGTVMKVICTTAFVEVVYEKEKV